MKKLTLGLLLTAATLPAMAESKFSAELLLGQADQESDVAGFKLGSGDDMSYGIRGSYLANKNIALELAYQNYGETDKSYPEEGGTTSEMLSSSAITLGVKGILPFDNGFSLHARAGLSVWDYKVAVTNTAFLEEGVSLKDDGNDLYYGIGMQYAINPQLSIGAEYTMTEMGATVADVVSIDNEVKNLGLTLSFNF